MVDVFLDRRLDDYFTCHDWGEVERDDAARDAVMADYLGEKIAILRGLDTASLDFDFLQTVRFPQTWAMKKFQFRELIDRVRSGNHDAFYQMILSDSFGGDEERFAYFTKQLLLIDAISTKLLGRLLEGMSLDKIILVARFSETRMENLHFDMDPDADDHEAFRLYVNLDANPRIWSTSYRMSDLVRRGGQRLLGGIDPSEKGETILKRVISRAFGGWNQRATERKAPRHQVYFDPGDVWIVDGRSVSHQVLSGHRVLSLYAKIPHASNPHVGPTFTDKLRSAFSEGMSVPIGEETADVNYFDAKAVTASPRLKEDWEVVFGQTRTGGIRRFDDAGLVTAEGQ